MKKWVLFFLFIPTICYGGIDFDGVDDLVDLGTGTRIDCSLPCTVSAWVRFTGSGTSAYFSNDGSSNNYSGILIGWTSDKPFLIFGDNTGGGATDRRQGTADTTLSTNTWYHIVWVARGASDMSVYVNGVADTITYSGTGGAIAYGSTAGTIGFANFNSTWEWTGQVTEVAIWDVELTTTEIAQLYSRVKRVPYQVGNLDGGANQLGYWDLNNIPEGVNGDGETFINLFAPGSNDGTGNDGADNSGLTGKGEEVLSYP